MRSPEDLPTALRRGRTDLADLVRIPSISAAQDRDPVQRSAERVRDLARDAGAQHAEVLSVAGGAPAVVASWQGPPAAPRVLLYAHHDVQPPGDLEAWTTDPFEPTERDGRIYGRGAADDKAGVMAHLTALRVLGPRPPVGVTLFVEGEEEIGSPTFEAFLAEHASALNADVIVVADSSNWTTDVPALTTTLRGVVVCDVEVRTATAAVHSGLAGGVVPDAVMVLARLVASLHHDDGTVAVAGLHRHPDPAMDYPADRVRSETSLLDGVDLIGTGPLASRMWTQPSVTVTAIDAPRLDQAAMVLPPVAGARVTLRVAPGQDAAEAQQALRRHLEQATPWGAQVRVTDGVAGPATVLDLASPYADLARAALTDAFDGTPPVQMGVGGSIPFITTLAETFPDAVVLVTGVGDPEASWHGPDENMHLATFDRVCRFEIDLLRRLGEAAAE